MPMEDRQKFTEIDVERINVVEKDGTVKMVISNKELSPEPIVDGRTIKTGRAVPGVIFYNSDGDECGGLVFDNKTASLTFDAYKHDQVVGLQFDEEEAGRYYGLSLWERPTGSIHDDLDRYEIIRQMPDGPEKQAAMQHYRAEGECRRGFLGRNHAGEVSVLLCDRQGKTRLRMLVDKDDMPRIEFLDGEGRVIYSLPPAGML